MLYQHARNRRKDALREGTILINRCFGVFPVFNSSYYGVPYRCRKWIIFVSRFNVAQLVEDFGEQVVD